jgi:hypothetical protein
VSLSRSTNLASRSPVGENPETPSGLSRRTLVYPAELAQEACDMGSHWGPSTDCSGYQQSSGIVVESSTGYSVQSAFRSVRCRVCGDKDRRQVDNTMARTGESCNSQGALFLNPAHSLMMSWDESHTLSGMDATYIIDLIILARLCRPYMY